MKIVFMGTPDFAVESLKALVENGYNVELVVSQSDKPKGRGMKLFPTPVKEYALSQNIEVVQPDRVKNNKEFEDRIQSIKPDLLIVVAYGKILPKSILDIPSLGAINVHGSLLPKYRGAAPIQRSIINGESVTGITTMYLDEGMDTGDMILKEEVEIEDTDTYETLHDKLKIVGARLLVKTLKNIESGTVKREKQPSDYTIAPMIDKKECKIDFKSGTKNIYNLIRGVYPFPCSYFELDDGRIFKIHGAKILSQNETIPSDKVGTVKLADSKQGLVIYTLDGELELTIIQEQSNKKMSSKDYLRGKKIYIGQKVI